ncbi:hypothetical protein F4810DRAFT_88020 [Camillea tinctor]|nr:hypothetical protein F4810DRAFT_88020 [Camillea tinctor]
MIPLRNHGIVFINYFLPLFFSPPNLSSTPLVPGLIITIHRRISGVFVPFDLIFSFFFFGWEGCTLPIGLTSLAPRGIYIVHISPNHPAR